MRRQVPLDELRTCEEYKRMATAIGRLVLMNFSLAKTLSKRHKCNVSPATFNATTIGMITKQLDALMEDGQITHA